MKRQIFYSWQSDLPSTINRDFIESAIARAIEELKHKTPFSIELTIDKDTQETIGTPDITSTIFNKIARSSVFVADVSIINSCAEGRKTPNPNVLIELGYAVKSLGWDRVICVYNKDFGSFEDLPFDIRHRKPLAYSIDGTSKSQVKENLAQEIIRNILGLQRKGFLFNELHDYLKRQVDTEILTLINWLSKIVYGYAQDANIMNVTSRFLDLTKEQIHESLANSEFLGFQVFKSFHEVEAKLQNLLDKVMASNYFGPDLATAIVNLHSWVGCFDAYTRSRSTPDLFDYANRVSSNYSVLSGEQLNPKNASSYPDRHLLLEKVTTDSGRVVDFGDFIEIPKIKGLLGYYRLNPKHASDYVGHIEHFTEIVNDWLSLTNDEFVLDTFKQFAIQFPAPKSDTDASEQAHQ